MIIGERDGNSQLAMMRSCSSSRSAACAVMFRRARRGVLLLGAAAYAGGAAKPNFSPGQSKSCEKCALEKAQLKRRDLAGADLAGADLAKAVLHRSRLIGSQFRRRRSCRRQPEQDRFEERVLRQCQCAGRDVLRVRHECRQSDGRQSYRSQDAKGAVRARQARRRQGRRCDPDRRAPRRCLAAWRFN